MTTRQSFQLFDGKGFISKIAFDFTLTKSHVIKQSCWGDCILKPECVHSATGCKETREQAGSLPRVMDVATAGRKGKVQRAQAPA